MSDRNQSVNCSSNGTLGDCSASSLFLPPPIFIVSRHFMFYSLSVIIPCGLLFNTLSIFVFMSRNLRRRSASWYLAALAFSDDISLITIMFDYWLTDPRIGLPLTRRSETLCLIVSYLSSTSRLYSALLVVSFTIERFVGVVFPLKRATLRSPSHVRRILVLEAVICLLAALYTWFTIQIVQYPGATECDVRPDKYIIYTICNIAIMIFGSIVLPILVICTLNTFMVRRIWLRKTFPNRDMTFSGSKPISGRRNRHNTATLLLVVSTTFVVLNTPYCVAWFILFLNITEKHLFNDNLFYYRYAAKFFTAVQYFLNFSINFLVYNICAEAFRAELLRFACIFYKFFAVKNQLKKRHSSRRETSRVTSSWERDYSSKSEERQMTQRLCQRFINVNVKVCNSGPPSTISGEHCLNLPKTDTLVPETTVR